MANTRNPSTDPGEPLVYQIRIKGHLGREWTEWFAGLTITLEDNGETLLTGPVVDQAALHGVLRKVRDLGIPLHAARLRQSRSSSWFSSPVTRIDPITATWRNLMKAMVYTHYGPPDVLQFTEVEKPLPQDHEVLIKVQAASVTTADRYLLSGPLSVRLIGGGLRKPKDQRLGTDLAGRVEAVGSAVTQFQPGDEVFGRGDGAFADYACATEKHIALKPTNLSFEAAAAVPLAALTALQGLRDS